MPISRHDAIYAGVIYIHRSHFPGQSSCRQKLTKCIYTYMELRHSGSCGSDEYEARACGGALDRVCKSCLDIPACASGSYMTPCGGGVKGQCATCHSCPQSQYLEGCAGSNPGTCRYVVLIGYALVNHVVWVVYTRPSLGPFWFIVNFLEVSIGFILLRIRM
jgi:hypothetical protein